MDNSVLACMEKITQRMIDMVLEVKGKEKDGGKDVYLLHSGCCG